jgi:hypothetical protein
MLAHGPDLLLRAAGAGCDDRAQAGGMLETWLDRAHRGLMHKPTFCALVLGMVTVAGVAAAQYPPPGAYPPAPGYAQPGFAPPRARFGNAGILAFSSDMNFAFGGHTTSIPNNTGDSPSGWEFAVKPSVDYFVIQGLSVGGFLEYQHSSTSTPNGLTAGGGTGSTTNTTDTFGVGARVGYNIPIADAFSLWPLLGLGFTTTSATGDVGNNAFTVSLFAPFLWHPVSHFFMGIGPYLSTDLAAQQSSGGQTVAGPKTTAYGLQFTIGGWFEPG